MSDVEDFIAEGVKLYNLGEWNPWTYPRPAIRKTSRGRGVLLEEDIKLYISDKRKRLVENRIISLKYSLYALSKKFLLYRWVR